MNELKTPYYVIDKAELNKNICDLKEALKANFKKYIIGYSFKTNSLPWIVQEVKKMGCYAEVVSFDEFNLACHFGYECDHIIYNGPMKDFETFQYALKNGAIVNIETKRELRWLEQLDKNHQYKVGIRINYDIEKMCPNESSGGEDGGRFGFCIHNDEFENAINTINEMKNVSLVGIHLHTSSKTRGLNIYKAISQTAVEVINKYSLELEYIDVGGGFFGGVPTKPSFLEYMSLIKDILNQIKNFETISVIVEPGAAIIASPISFVTSVIDVKKTNRNIFITTDGSRNDIDPLMRKKGYNFEIIKKGKSEVVEKQIISGFTCMEDDRLFVLNNHELLSEGDLIQYNKVGSYTMCLSPLFIKYFPAVYVFENGKYKLVREKWTVNEYVQNGVN